MESESKRKKAQAGAQTPENAVTRRKFLQRMGGLVIASSAAGMGLFKAEPLFASVGREVTIGTFGPSHCAATFVYTKLKGMFRQERLRVNLVNYSNMAEIAADLASGKLDFGQLVVPLAFAMHTGSKPFGAKVPVVIPQIAGTNGSALVIRSGSPIMKPADFKGKTVASHNMLSVNHLINVMFLDANDLALNKDVKFRQVDLDKVAQTMKAGEIDAFVMPEPADAMVEHQGIGKVYLLSKMIWPNHPCCALVCRRDFFDKNMSLVEDVTRFMTMGGLTINEPANRDAVVRLLQSTPAFRYDKIPADVLKKAFTPGRADFYPFPYQSSARIIIEIMKGQNLLASSVNDRALAQEVFLSDFSRKIMKELKSEPPDSDYRMEKILGKIKSFET